MPFEVAPFDGVIVPFDVTLDVLAVRVTSVRLSPLTNPLVVTFPTPIAID